MAQSKGVFTPTTQVWDVGEVQSANIDNKALKELLIRMYQNLNRMALSVDARQSGEYALIEAMNAQKWFMDTTITGGVVSPKTGDQRRQAFRKVFNWGKPLPNAASDTIPHNISLNNDLMFTHIYGVTRNSTGAGIWLPLPFASPTLANNIKLSVEGANIVIETGSNRTAFTETYIVLEYLKT